MLISPRRFGKSSVVMKALKQSSRQYIVLNMQAVTSTSDMAAKLLREAYRLHPFERVRQFVRNFRIMPTLSTNPVTGTIDVAFQPTETPSLLLEDVMRLLEDISDVDNRLVVVLDEFQEVTMLAPMLDRQLRSMMQTQHNINYILLGSQESMMEEIFEKKKSPFYHFGQLMRLKKLPPKEFEEYLSTRLQSCFPEGCDEMAQRILAYTDCHPYYTQQLAAAIWQTRMLQPQNEDVWQTAITEIIDTHSLDYERLWMSFNKTEKWVLQQLALGRSLQTGERRTSTVYSALAKLQRNGYVIRTEQAEIEDPFFCGWLKEWLQ